MNKEQQELSEGVEMGNQRIEAKPCPFCGWESNILESTNYETDQGGKWGRFICGKCLAKGPEVRTSYKGWQVWGPEAVTEWNIRFETAKDALIASLNAEISKQNKAEDELLATGEKLAEERK